MIGQLIAVLFLSRDLAHREHLRTTIYAAHIALGEFYDEIIGLADSLAEAYQGRHGKPLDIPLIGSESKESIADILQEQLDVVEQMRYEAIDKADTALQNIVDEIVGQYLSTLYKLRRFK